MKLSRIAAATILLFAFPASFSAQNVKTSAEPVGTMQVVGDSSLVVNQLETSVVSARIEPVRVVEDTVEYNPAAYRLTEDAMLEDLLAKIPGLEVRGNSVYLHGRRVDQILVNGKRFFGGDVKAGIQSLPADMIAKVCAYEIEPDETTAAEGDEAGNNYESLPVLDLKIKKNMMDGWRGNVSGGYGAHGRYSGKLSANNIKKESQTSVTANFNNLNGKISIDNASRSQLGGGNNCDKDNRAAGVNIYRKKDMFELDANAKYSGYDQDVQSRRYSETVYSTGITSVYGTTGGSNISNTPSADIKMVWRPSSQLSFTLKSSFKYIGTDNFSLTHNDNIAMNGVDTTSLADNGSQRKSNTYSGSLVFNTYRRFDDSKKGRTLSAVAEYYPSFFDAYNPQTYLTQYYKSTKADNDRRLFQDTDNRLNTVKASLQYNEPIAKRMSLNFYLQGMVQLRESTKDLYDLKAADPDWKIGQELPEGYADHHLDNLSFYGKYDWYSLRGQVQYRYNSKKIRVYAGVTVQPQWTELEYTDSLGSTGRHSNFLINAAPVISFNWQKQKSEKLSFSYISYPSQPAIADLIPKSNGTNPLYVRIGNEDLLPAYTHKMDLSYTFSDLKKQSSLSVNAQARIIQNKITDVREYVSATGGSISRPVNIDGNWTANASMAYDKGLPQGFSITQRASADYAHNLSYLYQSHQSELNTMHRFMVKERFEAQYRNWWLEVMANVYGDYTYEASELRPEINQQPFSLGCGLVSNFDLPWGMRITLDYSYLAQNNYALAQLNRDYHVLNASIRQSFLKKKLILSIEAYDCLDQLPNITTSFGSYSRNIVNYNGYNSYILGRLIYKFKF